MTSSKPLTVGVSLPLTGRFEKSAGVYYDRAYRLWEKQINLDGGLLGRPVELVVYDDESEAAKTGENYARLIDGDHVDLLLGPCHSFLVEAAAPIVEAAGKLLIQGSGSSHELFRKGSRSLFLCWSGCDFDYPKSFLEFATSDASPRKVESIALVYTDWRIGNAVAEGVRHHARAMGIPINFEEGIGDPPVDYAGMMQRAFATKPDALLIGLDHVRTDKPMDEAVTAALAAGFERSQIWLSDNPSPKDLRMGDAMDGIYMRGSWVPEDQSPLSVAFRDAFKDEYGYVPEYHSAGGYACCQVLSQVVASTGGTDAAVMREALLRDSFDTVMGELRFTESGLPDATIQLCQWQGESLEVVYPENARTKPAR
ncbi:MAG: ABC transporter substrate-binding protein [Chloroflexi bacterium]|nr:ABC transporter substrate-binding protein [Chloroflexota bacterium]